MCHAIDILAMHAVSPDRDNTMKLPLTETTRLDKWLWAARFFKTRTLATNAIELGRVLQNEQRVKPAHTVRSGDILDIHHGEQVWTVTVLLVSETRGPAPLAQTMYEETEASRTARATEAEKRRYFHEPAAAIHGRPTKRDRRRLDSGWG